MAKNNLIFALAFLFALLILVHAIRFTDEVRFSEIEKDEYYSGKQVTKMKYSRGKHGVDHDDLAATSKSDNNDFRPTSPGHSPSIGHSTPPNGHS
ncbi:C-TERMINALLY ENCODED PEPTIDE 3 [Hibiscus trionum]|uniref:C-TERMINALLY ENCODED PEPTIDE 3 n=1 Tax=Hibiscus trionum TaxID=183268 RepID=A0A9W7I8G1_HIBTR|nr:C-TERMINALLY ENCODED PEPTIDE 3 [Hibiscus trionum]